MDEEKFIGFVLEHEDDDPGRLLLSASRWSGIDVRRAARIIEARRKIRGKVPSWYAHPGLDYPFPLALEQCSSEATAIYKQAFVPEGGRIADLTGGLGVDCWFMSRKSSGALYFERNEELCSAAARNFAILEDGAPCRIEVRQGDGPELLRKCEGGFDLIYLDPARRGGGGRRLYDIADCEPNLLEIKDLLLSRSGRVLAKVSPMADISRTLEQIPETAELHVVASEGEVKELLLLLTPDGPGREPLIVAADGTQRFAFTPGEEREAAVRYADSPGKFLFQPSRALLKAGAFRLLSGRTGLAKLAPSTHLYTSDGPCDAFPGKCFTVEEVLPWSGSAARELKGRFDRVEMTALNFPMTTEALRNRIGIPDGGPYHLFATTMNERNKIIIICKPCAKTTSK